MKKTARAKISWIPYTEGGRKHPPEGERYSTVVHFKDDSDEWPEQVWSLVVSFDKVESQDYQTDATVWFLAHNHPDVPNHFLEAGNEFELLEGGKVVARGKIK